MPFIAECPFCGKKVRVPEHAVGLSLPCPGCGDSFTLAAMAAPPPSAAIVAAPAAVRSAIRQSLQEQATDPDTRTDGLDRSRAATDDRESADQSVPLLQFPSWVDPLGLVGFAGAAAGLVCASLPAWASWTFPLAGAGAVLGLVGLIVALASRDGRPLVWSLLGTTVGLGTVGTALCSPGLFGNPTYWAAKAPVPKLPQEIQAIPIGQTVPTREPGEGGWIDAGKDSARLQDVSVWVHSAAVQKYRDPQADPAQPPPTGLALRLQIANGGARRRLEYRGWGPGKPGETLAAVQLKDADGKSYRLLSGGATPEGGATPLPPGRQVIEVLVFENPPATAERLFLELPASAVGEAGTFRFVVPRAMIGKR